MLPPVIIAFMALPEHVESPRAVANEVAPLTTCVAIAYFSVVATNGVEFLPEKLYPCDIEPHTACISLGNKSVEAVDQLSPENEYLSFLAVTVVPSTPPEKYPLVPSVKAPPPSLMLDNDVFDDIVSFE